MDIPKVTPIMNGANIVKNHYLITTKDGVFFQSYEDIIAYKPSDPNTKIALDANLWDCSPTTRRWREVFLGECHHETLEKATHGNGYVLADLNK